MRLLRVNTHDLELVEFQADPPPYAILSHRWEAEEFLYTDLGSKSATQKAGFAKIRGALEQAKTDGLEYLWADTCCIDKANNTELSEAINSMYRWYKQAEICYAYLSDVENLDELAASKWFTRGWTLQELLAPQDLVFFSRDWDPIGTKAELVERLSDTTGIEHAILQGSSPIASASIAQRMSWVSERATTRAEDIAYCLLGIFDVNMPLIYGEGEKAFMRLQEQIANESDDQTLFAWTDPASEKTAVSGLLAKHPSHFIDSGYYVPCYDPQSSEPYTINKKRLKIQVRLTVSPSWYIGASHVAELSCADIRSHNRNLQLITVLLRRNTGGRGEFQRVHTADLSLGSGMGPLTTIWVPQIPPNLPLDRIIHPPHYSIILCNIHEGFRTRVNLIDYTYDTTVTYRNYDPRLVDLAKELKTDRKIALKGVWRHFRGECSPNGIAVELNFCVKHLDFFWESDSLRNDDTEFTIACGMTADLNKGFDVFETRKKIYWRFTPVPLDNAVPVKVSRSVGNLVYDFEFIPNPTGRPLNKFQDIRLNRFDLKITSRARNTAGIWRMSRQSS